MTSIEMLTNPKSVENEGIVSSIIKLDANERQGRAANWLNEALARFSAQDVQLYPDDGELIEKICQYYSLQIEQVAVFNGGDEAIYCWIDFLRQKGNVCALLPTPTFSVYPLLLQRYQIDTRFIECQSGMFQRLEDIKASLNSVNSNRQNWLVLVNPNNPTGQFFEIEALIEICQLAKQNNVDVLLDEAYIEFAYPLLSDNKIQASGLLKNFDNLLILRTFSKAYGLAGVRCGYLLGSKLLVNSVLQYRLPYSVNQLALSLASFALDNSAQAEIQFDISAVIKRREELSNRLKALGVKVLDSKANFVACLISNTQAELVKSKCVQFTEKAVFQFRLFPVNGSRQLLRITVPSDVDPLVTTLACVFQPQLICLDMDGVLIDVRESYDRCVIETVRYFTDRKISASNVQKKRNQTNCNDDWLLSQLLIADLGVDVSLDRVIKVFQAMYLGADDTSTFAEISQDINSPLSTNGLIWKETSLLSDSLREKLLDKVTAVVTSRPRAEAELGVSLIQLGNSNLISRDDAESKPSAEGIIKAAEEANATTLWMCGDNCADIKATLAARNAGFAVVAIGISGGCESQRMSLINAGADIVFSSINQMESLL